MAGVNKVILLGNLGSDPEVRHLDNGSVVARFNIATSEAYNNKSGERVEQTEWHRIEMWDNLAKIAEQYLKKGSTVYVEGRIRTENWTNKEGQPQSGIRIRATSMTLVGSSKNAAADTSESSSTASAQPATSQPAPKPNPEPVPDFGAPAASGEDDLPF